MVNECVNALRANSQICDRNATCGLEPATVILSANTLTKLTKCARGKSPAVYALKTRSRKRTVGDFPIPQVSKMGNARSGKVEKRKTRTDKMAADVP